ncbi:extensin-1-like [Salvia splendens]|uniref:extensin-1-like n=1 Tax=Salvia splendens TaxID=180675 RepID=UPI001C276946|nr:extensin-1-like [Salvia splendens]
MSYTYTTYHHHQFGQPHPLPETHPYQWPSLYAAPTTEYGQPEPPHFSDRPDPSYGLPWFGSRDEQPPYTAKTTAPPRSTFAGQDLYRLVQWQTPDHVQWPPPSQTYPQQIHYCQPPLLYPQPPDQPDWQCLPTTNDVGHMEPLNMPRDTVTPESESNLTVAALASQLERLTATVKQLTSLMDANKRCLSDPHAATQPPPDPTASVMYTEPVSCPLPQMTAAAPADLHHDPSRSLLPFVIAIPPPPATISLSCDTNFGYDSMELIVVDNDKEEKMLFILVLMLVDQFMVVKMA